MAAIVRTVRARRGNGGSQPEHEDNKGFPYDQPRPSDEGEPANKKPKNEAENGDGNNKAPDASFEQFHGLGNQQGPSVFPGGFNPKNPANGAAARKIQSWYRGVKIRWVFRKILGQGVMISSRAVNKILLRMVRTHYGWARFALNLTLLSMFVAMVIVQIFHASPSSPEVNQSLIAVVNSAGFDPVQGVTRSQQVLDYVGALLPTFQAATNPGTMPLNSSSPLTVANDTLCDSVYDQYCTLNNITSVSDGLLFLAKLVACLNNATRYNDGYIDNQNRLQFGFFLTQLRYDTTSCKTSPAQKNPLRDLPKHACLNPSSLALSYESEICGTPSNPNPEANCYRAPEFRFNNVTNNFVMVVSGGNLGDGFSVNKTLCRFEGLKEQGWLDYRTKQSCVIFFTVNENVNGRLAVFRSCFDFSVGGRAVYRRDVASMGLGETDPTVLGITGTFACVFVIWAIWELGDIFLFYRHRGCKCGLPRIGDVVVLVVIALCATDLGVFFPLYSRTVAFTYPGKGDLSQFANTDVFWSSMMQVLNLLQLWQSYYVLLAFTMFFFILQALVVLDFHPELAIVSGTLKLASKELLSFLLVYTIILILYSCLGMVFFGGNFPEFSNLGNAMASMLFISFMSIDNVGAMVLDPTVTIGVFENSNWIAVIWYYSYIILVSILLMNVVLSIIVGAFVDFQDRRKERIQHFGLTESLLITLHIWARYVTGLALRFWSMCKRLRSRNQPDLTRKDEEQGPPENNQAEGVAKLDKYNVIGSLNLLRQMYFGKKARGAELRRYLTELFGDDGLSEKLMAEMRQVTIRERYVPDVLSFKAKHFKEEQYKSHMLSMVEKVLAHSNAAAVAASRTSLRRVSNGHQTDPRVAPEALQPDAAKEDSDDRKAT